MEKIMRRVFEKVKVQNYFDRTSGQGSPREILIEALVDTGSAYLCLPSDAIEKHSLFMDFIFLHGIRKLLNKQVKYRLKLAGLPAIGLR